MPGENIFLFVPNLIGYARIVFAIVSFYFMPCCPLTASSFYLLSGLLDAFDGHAARALNQGTRFGAMLDMLTDRCSTMCLLVNLALLYPRATLLFQLSMSLDVASHWLHLHSSVVRGSESHKMIDLSGNPVLRIYYTSRPALFTLCAGNELFYCLLYLFHFSEGPLGRRRGAGQKGGRRSWPAPGDGGLGLLSLTCIPLSLYRSCSLPQLALLVSSEWASGSPPRSRRSSLSSVSSTWSLPPATWLPWMRPTEPGRSDPRTSSPWPPTCPGESR
uniref:CDP-diacylglycerol--inositol 3-phosphatidyltransferase n=1 Tax=Ursus maritimus TaxID=29073 RepID=A0A452U381_URSMA